MDPTSAKRPTESTHAQSGRTPKAPRSTTPPPAADKSTEGVGAYIPTPAVKRISSHANLTEHGRNIYAGDLEAQIAAEARGVTRKKVPWDTFCSIYLWDLKETDAPLGLDVDSVQNIGIGDWEETKFWDRLHNTLHDKVLHGLKLTYSGDKPLSTANKGKEVPSKPDFFLHIDKGDKEPPTWADMELLFEHTRSGKKEVTLKFSQWLRGAWSVFYHQPFRRHFYGIIFAKPFAYICYADHGCAAYSEPLEFVTNHQHTQYLIHFLSEFIAKPEHRGNDPTVQQVDGRINIQHAGKTWVEQPTGVLCYRPCVIGRHIRVAVVKEQDDAVPRRLVMKSTWEEKLPQEPSPPPEVEVLSILLEAGVRGLPMPYFLEKATVVDEDHLEVNTRSFPENGKVAFIVRTNDAMEKMQNNFTTSQSFKTLDSTETRDTTGDELLHRMKTQRDKFNKPMEVRRRLTRVMMSYCTTLKDAMRNAHPKSLMRSIRDSMIVYYEAYKLPKSGFLHGDISIENILVPVGGSELTGNIPSESRCGTLVDWNLCFSADGTSSSREFRSGTPAFMAPILLSGKPITRRTLAHDMESFFAVIIWIASLDYFDDTAFQAKPLASMLLDRKTDAIHIANAKKDWFKDPVEFNDSIIEHLERAYFDDTQFVLCLIKLRQILYSPRDFNEEEHAINRKNKAKEREDPDQMKEGLFRECMQAIDKYLGETQGIKEIKWIDFVASKSHSQTSESVGEGEDGSG